MSQAAATERVGIKLEPVLSTPSNAVLLRQLVLLALPVFAEQVLHMLVALTDTFVANHLVKLTPDMTAAQIAEGRTQIAAATAAVGTIGYIFWLIGLITGAIGTGSTAIIARATGARHRRLANSVCGQSVGAALFAGLGLWLIFGWGAPWVANIAQLHGIAHDFALDYLRMLGISLPFVTVMMVANACLRGAGDTVTPAVSMIIVDLVNMFFTWSLTFGSFHLPRSPTSPAEYCSSACCSSAAGGFGSICIDFVRTGIISSASCASACRAASAICFSGASTSGSSW